MAELGAIAGVTQLAGQAIICANALYNLFRQIKAAPKQIETLLQEISIVAQILKDVPSRDITGSEAIENALRYTTQTMEELQMLLNGLSAESVKTGLRRRLKLGSIMMVMKEKEVRELVERLRGAYNSLQFAVVCHGFFAVSRTQHVSRTAPGHIETESTESVILISPVNPTRNSSEVRQSMKKVTRMQSTWVGIGYLQTVSIQAIHSEDSEDSIEVMQIERKLLPASWTRLKGFAFCQGLDGGNWKYWFKPGNVVQASAHIFQACMYGNLEEVISLVQENKASIHDTTELGLTPLHVAAFHQRPSICEWLIKNGANSNEVDVKKGRTPLHLALSEAGRGDELDTGDLVRRSDCIFRKDDALLTLRILVEMGQCDPMATTTLQPSANMYSEQTPLHGCVGPAEAFTYLLQQDHFQIDLNKRNSHGLDVEQAMMTSTSYPEVSGMVGELRKTRKRQQNMVRGVFYIEHRPMKSLLHRAMFNIKAINFKRNVLSRIEEYREQREQGWKMTARWVAADILAEDSDIHSCYRDWGTILAMLLGGSNTFYHQEHDDPREPICQTILEWFSLLRDAGHDLQEYIQVECNIYPDYIYTPDEEVTLIDGIRRWSGFRKRSIKSDTDPDTLEMRFTIAEEYIRSDISEVDRIPGAWNHGKKINTYWYPLTEAMEPQKITFFIRRLQDGIQTLGLVKDE